MPNYFIAISLITAALVITSGLLITLIDHNFLSNRFYQSNRFANSQVYLQMMDQVIPGQVLKTEESPTSQRLLKSIFGINIKDPISLIKSEIPSLRNYNEAKQQEEIEYVQLPVQDPKRSISSSLSDERPVAFQNIKTPSIFVYHTHNRESWNPTPFHSSQNITLVGKHFADKLERIGIPVQYDNTDHEDLLLQKDMKRALAYVVSSDTVVAAMQKNPEIDYIFDFHRDAVARKYTTVNIDGVDYAKIMFVIGKQNKHWEENLAFAEKIQKILDDKYPGLCRPIVGYEHGKAHNGEYNQSFSNQALTVEIGGIENTLEESKRTVELLADAFAEVYLEAVPVISQLKGEGQ